MQSHTQTPSLNLLAWARISDQTQIQYAVCQDRMVELTVGGPEGLTLDITEQGLLNLFEAVTDAVRAFRAMHGPASAA